LAVIEFPSEVLEDVVDEGAAGSSELSPKTYVADLVLHELTLGVLDELMRPTELTYLELLKLSLVTHALRQYGFNMRPMPSGPYLSSRQRRQVLECMREGLEGDLSVSTLADVAGTSVAHFARAFRRTFREPPHRLILRWRLERAVRFILVEGSSFAEAACAAGFYDQAHMTNVMRRHFGLSPRHLLSR
jgi:AraC family transcriptional regulator